MARKYEFKPDRPYSGFWGKLHLTRQQRRAVLKWALYALLLVGLSVLQDVLLCRLRLFGATTELVPCGIFLICLLEGMERGCVFVLVASLLYYFSGEAAGLYSVAVLTVLGTCAAWVRQSYLQRGFGAAMLCTGAAMAVYELTMFATGVFLGLTTFPRIFSFLLTAAMTMAVAPGIYFAAKAIGGGDAWKE